MFSWFRRLLRAIQAVGDAVIQIVAVLRDLLEKLGNDSALAARVEELERSRALWEAEIEAQGVKVEARVRALRATEERIRLANRRADEAEDDDEATGSPATQAAWAQFDATHAGGSDASAVPSVRPRVADRGAAAAKKWGR